jgi:hypothetical protein
MDYHNAVLFLAKQLYSMGIFITGMIRRHKKYLLELRISKKENVTVCNRYCQ